MWTLPACTSASYHGGCLLSCTSNSHVEPWSSFLPFWWHLYNWWRFVRCSAFARCAFTTTTSKNGQHGFHYRMILTLISMLTIIYIYIILMWIRKPKTPIDGPITQNADTSRLCIYEIIYHAVSQLNSFVTNPPGFGFGWFGFAAKVGTGGRSFRGFARSSRGSASSWINVGWGLIFIYVS